MCWTLFLIHFTKNIKNFIKKSSTRRKGEQFTIGMLIVRAWRQPLDPRKFQTMFENYRYLK
ncbi:hypothetical protein HMPREF9554_01088 [Treponema phagedenis F0421]|nr:hypothetical protein HMPREF9554_01088 [Treponema phagedenis F0421]